MYGGFRRYLNHRLTNEKAILCVYCDDNIQINPFYQLLIESIPREGRDMVTGARRRTCVCCRTPSILIMNGEENYRGVVVENYDMVKYLFVNKFVKGFQVCDICCEDKKQFKICYRCEKPICIDCFNKLNKVCCVYCNYTLSDHLENDD